MRMVNFNQEILFFVLGFVIPGCIIILRKFLLHLKIDINDMISCVENKETKKLVYRIKIRNFGLTALYNLKVYARLEIRDLEKKNTYNTFDIPLSFDGDYPYLPSFRATIMHIKCEEIRLDCSYYKKEVVKKLGLGDLKDLMLLGEKAILHIVVQAQDSSGVCLTKVKKFYQKDIKNRKFKK